MFKPFATLAAPALALALLAGPAALASPVGDDGLHKPDWLQDTFKDLSEDLAEANAEGKRLLLMIEQRGCLYCAKMHEDVYPVPEIDALIREHYFVVQINMFGGSEITDFDGEALTEKEAVRRWGVVFTPTLIFLPEEVPEGETAAQAAVATMPGAFEKGTTRALFQWVVDHGYDSGELFQEYLIRNMRAAN